MRFGPKTLSPKIEHFAFPQFNSVHNFNSLWYSPPIPSIMYPCDFPATYRPDGEAQRRVAWLCLVFSHQRRRGLGRRVPLPAHGLPNAQHHRRVFRNAVADVFRRVRGKRYRGIPLPPANTCVHRAACRGSLSTGMGLPYRGDVPGNDGARTARRHRRRAAEPRVGRLP